MVVFIREQDTGKFSYGNAQICQLKPIVQKRQIISSRRASVSADIRLDRSPEPRGQGFDFGSNPCRVIIGLAVTMARFFQKLPSDAGFASGWNHHTTLSCGVCSFQLN